MKYWPLIFVMLSALLVGAIYFSSSTSIFVEAKLDSDITCSPQDGGKTYCCAQVLDKDGYHTTTYCTTCDDTKPPSNCTPRERPMTQVNPGRDLSNILGSTVLEESTTLPNLSQSLGANRGGVLQTENNLTFSQANISSSNSSNNTIPSEQSELVMSETLENSTKAVNSGEQVKDESVTTEEGAGEAEDNDKEDENESEDEDKDTDKNDEESQPQEQ
jgi:hypothetical protein